MLYSVPLGDSMDLRADMVARPIAATVSWRGKAAAANGEAEAAPAAAATKKGLENSYRGIEQRNNGFRPWFTQPGSQVKIRGPQFQRAVDAAMWRDAEITRTRTAETSTRVKLNFQHEGWNSVMGVPPPPHLVDRPRSASMEEWQKYSQEQHLPLGRHAPRDPIPQFEADGAKAMRYRVHLNVQDHSARVSVNIGEVVWNSCFPNRPRACSIEHIPSHGNDHDVSDNRIGSILAVDKTYNSRSSSYSSWRWEPAEELK
jgi:hypothetical protein